MGDKICLSEAKKTFTEDKEKICGSDPYLQALDIGGGLTHRYESEHDVDVVPRFKEDLWYREDKVEHFDRVMEAIPEEVENEEGEKFPVDKTFFTIADENGKVFNWCDVRKVDGTDKFFCTPDVQEFKELTGRERWTFEAVEAISCEGD